MAQYLGQARLQVSTLVDELSHLFFWIRPTEPANPFQDLLVRERCAKAVLHIQPPKLSNQSFDCEERLRVSLSQLSLEVHEGKIRNQHAVCIWSRLDSDRQLKGLLMKV